METPLLLGVAGDAAAPGDSVTVEARGPHAALATWRLPTFSKLRAKQVWSAPADVGGFSVRLLLYPRGDSQALPGHLSLYVQVSDPRAPTARWDCFASYRLAVQHATEPAKAVARDSWHRFSGKKRSHGWCDFAALAALAQPGFCLDDTLVITAEIMVLHESVAFEREGAPRPDGDGAVSVQPVAAAALPTGLDVLAGKFTWRVHNFSLFQARAPPDARYTRSPRAQAGPSRRPSHSQRVAPRRRTRRSAGPARETHCVTCGTCSGARIGPRGFPALLLRADGLRRLAMCAGYDQDAEDHVARLPRRGVPAAAVGVRDAGRRL
jgi:hypothetical protein